MKKYSKYNKPVIPIQPKLNLQRFGLLRFFPIMEKRYL